MQAAQVFALVLSMCEALGRLRKACSLVKNTWTDTENMLETVRLNYEKAHPTKG